MAWYQVAYRIAFFHGNWPGRFDLGRKRGMDFRGTTTQGQSRSRNGLLVDMGWLLLCTLEVTHNGTLLDDVWAVRSTWLRLWIGGFFYCLQSFVFYVASLLRLCTFIVHL